MLPIRSWIIRKLRFHFVVEIGLFCYEEAYENYKRDSFSKKLRLGLV